MGFWVIILQILALREAASLEMVQAVLVYAFPWLVTGLVLIGILLWWVRLNY